jgi:hypothetical protein
VPGRRVPRTPIPRGCSSRRRGRRAPGAAVACFSQLEAPVWRALDAAVARARKSDNLRKSQDAPGASRHCAGMCVARIGVCKHRGGLRGRVLRRTNALDRCTPSCLGRRTVSGLVCQKSANDCALHRNEGFFAGARIIGVVGFASPSKELSRPSPEEPTCRRSSPQPQRPSLAWVGDEANRQRPENKSGRHRCAPESSLQPRPTRDQSRACTDLHCPVMSKA